MRYYCVFPFNDFFVFTCNCSRRKFGFYLSKVTVETGNLRPHIIVADSPPSLRRRCTQKTPFLHGPSHRCVRGAVETQPMLLHNSEGFAPIISPKTNSSCTKTMRRLYHGGYTSLFRCPLNASPKSEGVGWN